MTIPCCVCGTVDATEWRIAGDNLLGGDATYRAVRCVRCRMCRLDPRPADLSVFYAPNTYARAEGAESEIGRRLDVFNNQIAERADGAVGASETVRRVLDVGCGDGRFLAAMARRGWEVSGTETDPVAAQLAERRTGATIYTQPLENLILPAGTFDLISLLHVLEHLPEPHKTLRECYRLLRPGGILLIAVPNSASAEAGIFGGAWYHLDLPRHLWGFTPHSLTRLVEESGLENPKLRYSPFLFAPQSVRNLLRRLKPTKAGDGSGIVHSVQGSGGKLQTRVFLALLSLSNRLGNHLPGEIMELTAQHPANK